MQPILLIAAGAAFIGAFALRSVQPDKPALGWAAFGAGAILVAGGFVVPQITDDAPDVELTVVAPEDGEQVAAGEEVTIDVEVEGGEIASSPSDSGGHLHIYVDGRLEQMPSGSTTEIQLQPGEHEITVEFVDAEHASFEPPIDTDVRVTAR